MFWVNTQSFLGGALRTQHKEKPAFGGLSLFAVVSVNKKLGGKAAIQSRCDGL